MMPMQGEESQVTDDEMMREARAQPECAQDVKASKTQQWVDGELKE